MRPIVFSCVTSTGIVSAGIRQATHSQFSHVEWLMPDGQRLGARADGGVLIRPGNYAKFSRELQLEALVSDAQYRDFEDFMRLQLGKSYDFIAIGAFIVPALRKVDWRRDEHWFCSELMAAGAEKIGLYNDTKLVLPFNGVAPGDFALVTRPFTKIIYSTGPV